MLKKYSKWYKLFILPLWILVGFFVAQVLTLLISYLLKFIGRPLSSLPDAVASTVIAAIVYIVMFAVVVGFPVLVKKMSISKRELGLGRWPSWMDLVLAPICLVAYVIYSALLIMAAEKLIPGFNIDQVQDVGFSNLAHSYQYYLAMITLVIMAPLAEELIFRGFLFSKLRQLFPFWLTTLVVSVAFGAIHGAWNVAVDTFALSVMLCILREYSGSIWASVLLHMIKNGIAFYVLFIIPLL